jgi:hypothetical protein
MEGRGYEIGEVRMRKYKFQCGKGLQHLLVG